MRKKKTSLLNTKEKTMGRDPVDVAELERDYDETHGPSHERLKEKLNHEANEADMKYGEDDD